MNSGFDVFCSQLLARPDWKATLSPMSLAREFVEYFNLSDFPRFQEIQRLLKGAGVGELMGSNLPDGLRGVHFGTEDGQYAIHYAENEWEGSWDQTILHETYEILQEKLQGLCQSYRAPKGKQLCRQADCFAAVVLLQPEMFSFLAETTGFDVVALQRLYRRSYASVALRLVEVMRDQPLLVALYDRRTNESQQTQGAQVSPRDFVATVVARTPGFSIASEEPAEADSQPFVPIRGLAPSPFSTAAKVIESGASVYVKLVTGHDHSGVGNITVAAQPVLWNGQVARVVVVAVPWRDRSVLEPQLRQKPFHRIEQSFKVI